MKQQLTLIGFLLFSMISAKAQIVLDQSDFLQAGAKITMTYDTSGPVLNFGNAGAGQTWDFTNVTNTGTYNSDVLSPTGLPKAANFPQATAAFQYFQFNTQYYENTPTELKFLGTVVTLFDTSIYKMNYDYLRYPVSLGSNHTDESDISLIDRFFFGFDPDATGPHPIVDSIANRSFEIYESHIDAEGLLKTPIAEYQALRQFSKLTSVDSSYMYANGKWQPMSPNMLSILMAQAVETDTSYTYVWLAKDMSLPVFTIDYEPNSTGNDVLVAQWTSLIPTGISDYETHFDIDVFPNPFTSELKIQNNEAKDFRFEIHNSLGAIVESGAVSSSKSLDLSSLPKGIYSISLISENQKMVKKLIKH